ncbi:DNA polymerase III subunit delta [Patescibacteria group bacterium]|nr:DNA polymerase III subunit delta [Patescibacteria group bacterium]
MNYCLIGKDKFRIRERVKAIVGELTAEFANLQQVHISSVVGLTELAEHLDTQSLWSEQKLVVIEELLSSKDKAVVAFIQTWLKQTDFPTNLILIEENDPPKKIFQNLLETPTIKIERYPMLTTVESHQWLQQKLRAEGMDLDVSASGWLLANFENDLWRLSNELTKLKWLFADKTTSLAMVKEVVSPILGDNVFATIDALARRNLVLANRLINTQLMVGVSELELVTLIAYQFRNVALIKILSAQKLSSSEIAQRATIHPYVVKKSIKFARDFSWPQLHRIVRLIQKIDQASKRGQTPPKIGLDILMAQIVKS